MVVDVLIPGPGGDGSWIDAALAAARAVDARVHVGVPDELPPGAEVVLCHGIQYEALARRSHGPVIVLSDRPDDLTGLEHVTVVDWAWHEAAFTAGSVAATLSPVVGLVAGPAVRTQRRLASAFTAGAVSVRADVESWVVHLTRFDDLAGGARAGRRMVEALGCQVIMTSADAAGARAAGEARERGASTFGFLTKHEDDLGYVRSDIAGVLTGALRCAANGETLPREIHAGLASGHLTFEHQ